MKLDDETCDFLSSGVSIVVASRNAQLIPSLCRAKGCQVVGATSRIRLILSAAQAGDLLNDIRECRLVSATFTAPSTHRTLQLRGSDAAIDAVNNDDQAVMRQYEKDFADDIRPLGFSDEFSRAFLATSGDEIAIEFTATEAFQQTPGPSAGARLP